MKIYFAKPLLGITGTVTDPGGASLCGAVIKVTNLARAETISLASTASGQYMAVNLIPGIYEVRADVPGFRPSVLTGVEVKVDEMARVDVQLKVGNGAEVVTVAADTELLKRNRATLGSPGFGTIASQRNNPRTLQVGLKLNS
jgi:hypothetical protein